MHPLGFLPWPTREVKTVASGAGEVTFSYVSRMQYEPSQTSLSTRFWVWMRMPAKRARFLPYITAFSGIKHLHDGPDLRTKRAILILVTLLIVAGALTTTYVYIQLRKEEQTACRTVSVADAKGMIESIPSLVILDVSTEAEYSERHLKGAINIPLSDLPNRMADLDSKSVVLVYCRTGRRSSEACALLAKGGFTKVYNMEGGIVAWMNSGNPVVTEKVNLASEI